MRYRLIWIVVVVVAVAVGVSLGLKKLARDGVSPVARLPVYGQLPDFTLTERTGRIVTLAELRSQIWIADFIFTRCPGPCPLMSARMASLQQPLARMPDVRLVSISVDPEYDTPQVLREYAAKFSATDQWYFLTGNKPAIFNLAREGFHLAAQDNPDAASQPDQGPIIHSTKFVLVDRQARIRGYYDSTDGESLRQLLLDVQRLQKTTMNDE
jgi:protein SCO1/2